MCVTCGSESVFIAAHGVTVSAAETITLQNPQVQLFKNLPGIGLSVVMLKTKKRREDSSSSSPGVLCRVLT